MKLTNYLVIRWILVLFVVGCSSPGRAQEFNISVRSEHGEGVQSNVFYAVESDRSLVGRTDGNGHLLPKTPCSTPQDILAEPTSPEYLPGRTYCSVDSGTVVVKVFNRQFTERLARALERYATAENQAFEALLANELYARYAASDIAVAYTYKARIQPAAMEYLIDLELLPESGAAIGTTQLEAAIRNLQESRGLPQTGKLDYQTLSTAAGVDVGEVIATENFQLDRARIQDNDQMQR